MGAVFQFLIVSKELVLTLVFSLFPILIGSLLAAMWTSTNFKDAISENFSSGEVFIYTSAFLTPYILGRLKEGGSKVVREFCFYLFLYALLMGTFLFISVRLESLLAIKMNVNRDVVSWGGYSIMLTTLVLWYYSIWPNYKVGADIEKIQRDRRNELAVATDKLIEGAGK
ncbi:MAG: hypothetical protein A3J71_01715 [Pseudomonadales bacterium RIFCSPHIGHO2_02_FULL_60_43]|nr:MAG: hypothetical protein A3J71_01715 [Pseudomonadales bacterium RIFCSPHIGHO2_02_FULL_60_43]